MSKLKMLLALAGIAVCLAPRPAAAQAPSPDRSLLRVGEGLLRPSYVEPVAPAAASPDVIAAEAPDRAAIDALHEAMTAAGSPGTVDARWMAAAEATAMPLALCPANERCVVRALADVNGDGADDVLLEVGKVSLTDVSTARRYRLMVSAGSGPSAGLNHISIDMTLAAEKVFASVDSADLDGDGRRELFFYTALKTNEGMKAVVNIVRGRPDWHAWPAHYDIGRQGEIQLGIPGNAQGTIFSKVDNLRSAVMNVGGDSAAELVVVIDGQEFFPGICSIPGGYAQTDSLMVFSSPSFFAASPSVKYDQRTGLNLGCDATFVGAGELTGDKQPDLLLRACSSASPVPRYVIMTADSGSLQYLTPNIPGPRGGGGAGWRPPLPPLAPGDPPYAFVRDVNGDGIDDVGMPYQGRVHLWYGGPNLVADLATAKTSAVWVNADLGATTANGSWRPLRSDPSPQGPVLVLPRLGAENGADGSLSGGLDLSIFAGLVSRSRVLDLGLTATTATWATDEDLLWGVADLNGDRNDDLLLGSPRDRLTTEFKVLVGPLVTTRAW